MSAIHIGHIRTVLLTRFASHVDTSDLRMSEDQPDPQAVLSRALAAFAVAILSGDTESASAAAVVDGFDDNGIDAVYYDKDEPCLYFVQSKWVQNGTGYSPSVADVKKFFDGVRDIVEGRFDRFNAKVQSKQREIQLALSAANCKCRLAYAHTGTQELSTHARRAAHDFMREMNDTTDIVFFQVLAQRELHSAASRTFNRPIDLEIVLNDWGHVEEPYKAYYGHVNADQVAGWWLAHGNRLFEKNLRRFLGDSSINTAMAESLLQEGKNFWYFNNGITVLCTEVAKKLVGGSTRRTGIFECRGVSVVNGAQTVGTIGKAKQTGVDRSLGAKVMVRLISLDSCPQDFAARLTRAANTQNRIQQHDFAALDPEQARIATELQFDRITYAYKSGDPSPDRNSGFTIEEATVALACSARDSKLAMFAKGFIGKLWQNVDGDPYQVLFNPSVSGQEVWQKVKVLRQVENALDVERESGSAWRHDIAVHGNRFVLRQVFRALRATRVDADTANVALVTKAIVDKLDSGLSAVLKDVHLAWTFKAHAKCAKLEDTLFKDLERGLPLEDVTRRKVSGPEGQMELWPDPIVK